MAMMANSPSQEHNARRGASARGSLSSLNPQANHLGVCLPNTRVARILSNCPSVVANRIFVDTHVVAHRIF